MENTNDSKFSRLTGFLKIHGEWASLMLVILGGAGFLHHQDSRMTDRLDSHMSQINNRVDILHQEYFELLKEMRDKK